VGRRQAFERLTPIRRAPIIASTREGLLSADSYYVLPGADPWAHERRVWGTSPALFRNWENPDPAPPVRTGRRAGSRIRVLRWSNVLPHDTRDEQDAIGRRKGGRELRVGAFGLGTC